MLTADFREIDGQIGALVARFAELPRHLAKKHLRAALRATVKPAVPMLRANTPPLGTRRGRRKKGEKRSTGSLRRAVTTRAGYRGTNSFGFAFAVLGYKYGAESKKALWLEFGTSHGVRPQQMVYKTEQAYAPKARQTLTTKLAEALEKASRELASKKNPGMSRRGLAAGIAPRG